MTSLVGWVAWQHTADIENKHLKGDTIFSRVLGKENTGHGLGSRDSILANGTKTSR